MEWLNWSRSFPGPDRLAEHTIGCRRSLTSAMSQLLQTSVAPARLSVHASSRQRWRAGLQRRGFPAMLPGVPVLQAGQGGLRPLQPGGRNSHIEGLFACLACWAAFLRAQCQRRIFPWRWNTQGCLRQGRMPGAQSDLRREVWPEWSKD